MHGSAPTVTVAQAPAATAPASPSVTASRPTRLPALDGLRGLALLGMLAWHAQLDWVKGGFARMTIFFVLAGFLATKTTLRLHDRQTERPFVTFWGRRARRLLPVTLLGVLLAIATTALVGGAAARDAVVGDAASVIASVSNWRFIIDERPYGALFETPSAFQHFWSLSVEEQLFLFLPLVMFAVGLRRGRRRRPPRVSMTAKLLGGAALLALIPVVIPHAADTAYYGTHVRAAEFLVGAALAVWWTRSQHAEMTTTTQRVWATAGAAGLIILVVVMLTLERDQDWLYRGGMALFALPAAAAIGGILVGGRFVSGVLGVAPLATLGRWALSIYALHWPIYLLIEDAMAGRPRGQIVVVSIGLSIAVGGVVHHLVERPLMPGSDSSIGRAWSRRQFAIPAGVGVVALCLALAVAVPATPAPIDFDSAVAGEQVTVGLSRDEAAAILTDPGAATVDMPVFRDPNRTGVGLFGGSTALSTALGGAAIEASRPDVQPVPGYAPLGCGVLWDGVHHDPTAARERLPDGRPPDECADRDLRWEAATALYDIDVAVIATSRLAFLEWQFGTSDEQLRMGDATFDAIYASELADAVDSLHDGGARLVLLMTPVPPSPRLPPAEQLIRRTQIDAHRRITDEVARQSGVAVVDLTTWAEQFGDDDYLRLFPDGVHASQEAADRIWREILEPAIPSIR